MLFGWLFGTGLYVPVSPEEQARRYQEAAAQAEMHLACASRPYVGLIGVPWLPTEADVNFDLIAAGGSNDVDGYAAYRREIESGRV